MDKTEQLFKELTEAPGVPGYEHAVRAIMRKHLASMTTIEQDKLGSIVAKKVGSSESPRVMLAGHLDEVGFMVRYITKEGFIKFVPLGGWWDQVLLGHRVVIKTAQGDRFGVIGAKPPHLLEKEDREKIVTKNDMYIDIGATSEDEVKEMGVHLGDPIIPVSDFTILADGKTYLAKAWDNRIGCALVMDAIAHFARNEHPNTIFGVGTVQEEVGTRGAKTSSHRVNPDVALVFDSDIAGDVPGIKKEVSAIKIGGGPSILLYDAGMIPNLKLRDLVIATAKEEDIPLQFSAMPGGATDGMAIHLHRDGVPTIAIAVPARHIHSHNSIIRRDDYDNALKLVIAMVKKLDANTVEDLTA